MAEDASREHVIPYCPRKWAIRLHNSLLRWAALVLHRRAGKTTCVLNHHQRAALDDDWERTRLRFLMPSLTDWEIRPLLRERHYGHVMPTYRQAKNVAWDMLKYYASTVPGIITNESELSVKYPNKCRVQLFGADNPDSLRGMYFSGLSFDEFSQQPRNIFSEVLSKALADHLGYAIFCGTIKGKDHLYTTHEKALNNPEWLAVWQDIDASLTTEDGVTIKMLERAMTDDRALVMQGLMTQDEFDQEWYLSPEAAIKGAIFGKELAEARKAGRMTRVPYDPAYLVDTDWDLGVSDATSIWMTQSKPSGEVAVIDYYEAHDEGLPHYVNVLKQKGYVYGTHWAPHDIEQREFSSGRTRRDIAADLGIHFQITTRTSTTERGELADGLYNVRLLLPRCWFDAERCARGLDALRHYRWAFNTNMHEFKDTPVHDWSSHGADAFRGLAVRHMTPRQQRPRSEHSDPVERDFQRLLRHSYGVPVSHRKGLGRGGYG